MKKQSNWVENEEINRKGKAIFEKTRGWQREKEEWCKDAKLKESKWGRVKRVHDVKDSW